MAIHQSKKQSDLEKRLKLLRLQVYGKRETQSTADSYQLSDKKPSQVSSETTSKTMETESHSVSSDLNYLNQDLLKIATLSSIAIGAQFILFFLIKNNLLRLNFF